MPMIISLPYVDLVLSVEDAVTLAKIFEKAERYKCQYKGGDTTHHVFLLEDGASMRMITNDTYAMYKLAGKPED
jgi:hypothetical protein